MNDYPAGRTVSPEQLVREANERAEVAEARADKAEAKTDIVREGMRRRVLMIQEDANRQEARAEVAEAGLAQAIELLHQWRAYVDNAGWTGYLATDTRMFLASYPVSKKEET